MHASRAIVGHLPANPDVELAERHRYGDSDAFDEVYERYAGMVYGLCLRMSGDPVRAQDLSQEVFLRIFKGLGRFRGRSSLKTWVYRIALNHCRGRLARRRVATQSLDSTPLPEACLEDPARGPETRAEEHEAEQQVMRLLETLPRRFREAVILRDLQDLSYEEIATVLGVRIGTVRSRIARGRERLRRELEARS